MRSDQGKTKNARQTKAPLISAMRCLGRTFAISEQIESGKIIAALTKLSALPAIGTVVETSCVVKATMMFQPEG